MIEDEARLLPLASSIRLMERKKSENMHDTWKEDRAKKS